MDRKTAEALADLNRVFYRERAAEFAATREDAWPGWRGVLECVGSRALADPFRVLDVGCGNGRFARFLDRTLAPRGRGFRYVGLDSSRELLERARDRELAAGEARWICADWSRPSPERALPAGRFELVALFGVLHHVPWGERRRGLLEATARRLAPGGYLALSAWQFALRERFRRRLVAWDEHNQSAACPIDPDQLEPGDHLLRWGHAEAGGVRYCHFADAAELEQLSAGLGLERVADYLADGREGDLNRYLVLRAEA